MPTWLPALLQILAPIIAILVTKITKKSEERSAKIEGNNKILAQIESLRYEILTAVRLVDREYVHPLKISGTFGLKNMVEAKNMALAKIKIDLGTEGLVNLANLYQTDSLGVDAILATEVESAIFNIKKDKKIGSISLG